MKPKHIISVALILFAIFQYSCEPELNLDRCDLCTEYAPGEGKVLLDLTINEENPEVIFYTYEGKNTDTPPVRIDTTTSETKAIFLKTEQHYSFEAVYNEGDKEIHAFDGGEIGIREIECDDEPCYYATVLNIDISLIQN